MIESLIQGAISLLKNLIETPSFSREEHKTAALIASFLNKNEVPTKKHLNNIIAQNKYFDPAKPTVLLNSHHDTVKPVKGWNRDPFKAILEQETLYGLGSNDAGASLVSLIATFLYFYDKKDLAFNLIIAATAEEEISGSNGIASILDLLPKIEVAIVGEPTEMEIAVAEKGLMVIDGIATGKAGHAAREEGINALYIALEDIRLLRDFNFAAVSPILGKTKISITQISAGTQHNVVPDNCSFVIDIRTNEFHSNEFVHEELQKMVKSKLTPRSYRLNSSKIDRNHPLVLAAIELGCQPFGSPTLSDQALMPFTSLKMGVGDSARSHTADEFIKLSEISAGIKKYIQLLETLKF